MNILFIGLIFVFLDFNLNLGSVQIGLIPDFIGYILMMKGLDELSDYGENFLKSRPMVIGMAIYTGLLYALSLFGMSSVFGGVLSFILGLVSTIVSLYITYLLVIGIKDIENLQSRSLQSESLYMAWKVLAILSVVIYLAVLIPALGIFCLIAGLIVNIYFLVLFNRSKNLFYQYQ